MVRLCRNSRVLVLTMLLSCGSSGDAPVLLTVGDIEITESEFLRRFELNPRMLQYKDVREAKYRYLGSLVAEKLLAQAAAGEAMRRNRAFLDQIRREAVIEALYNRETNARIEIDEDEIRQAFERSRITLSVAAVRFDSLQHAVNFAAAARRDGSLPSAVDASAPGMAGPLEHEQTTLTWGSADPELENAIYQLLPGEISDPIAAQNQYHVVQILEKQIDAFPTETEYQLREAKIRQKLIQRKRGRAFAAFFRRMMAGKKTDVDARGIHAIVERLLQRFEIGTEGRGLIRSENPGPLTESELTDAMTSLDDLQDAVLVTFAGGANWTVADFLERLSVGRHHIDFSDRQRFRSSIRQALITLIEQEYVFIEGLKRGADRSDFVVDEVAMWRENLAAHTMMYRLFGRDVQAKAPAAEHLDDAQLRRLTTTLGELLAGNPIDFDRERFEALETVNAGLLALKTHFPGRMVVPINIPLENLESWQDMVLAKLTETAK